MSTDSKPTCASTDSQSPSVTSAGEDLRSCETAGRLERLLKSARTPAQTVATRIERDWARAQAARGIFGEGPAAPKLGRFVLGERLGAGGMGVVFRADDPELEREVAVKLVGTDSGHGDLLAEAQTLARLSHPNVVTIHDVGVVDGVVYIVMELLRGPTLRKYSAAQGRTAKEILAAYRAAGEGLVAAHDLGIVHRDFKPDNVLLGEDGRVRVIDFGLARSEHRGGAPGTSLVTRPGVGTPRYMPPEQQRGDALTGAADQYAFSASLREALERRVGAPEKLPQWIDDILRRGMLPGHEDRFASLRALLDALARDPAKLWRRRLAFAGAGAAIVAGYVLGTATSEVPPPDPCRDGDATISAAWPATERAKALEHVAALDGDYAVEAHDRIQHAVAAFADGWSDQYRDACLAHAAGEQSSELLDRRMLCLDRSKSAYAMAGRLTSEATAARLAGLVNTVATLPDPRDCGNLGKVMTADPPPPKAHALGERLARWRIATGGGRSDLAQDSTEALVRDARALGYAPMVAEALLIQGLERIAEGAEEAVPVLKEATLVALEAGAYAHAVNAWAQAAYSSGMKGEADALDGVELITAIAARVQGSVAAVNLHNNLGSVALAQNRREAARVEFETAIARAKVIGTPSAQRASRHSRANLALVTADAGKRRELIDEAVAGWNEFSGPGHPNTLRALLTRAHDEESDHRAAELYAPLCPRYQALHPGRVSQWQSCWFRLALAADQSGQQELARHAAKQITRPGVRREIASAYVALWDGKAHEAELQLRAFVKQRGVGELPWFEDVRLAEAEFALARAALELGRPDSQQWFDAAENRYSNYVDIPMLGIRQRLAFLRTLSGGREAARAVEAQPAAPAGP